MLLESKGSYFAYHQNNTFSFLMFAVLFSHSLHGSSCSSS
ncbi:hypothetical protein D350_00456 [Enterococcus faecalis VC1B-1]|nr:hypothetical protein D350_00456 [Enterococcus faecalis VC1B-1]